MWVGVSMGGMILQQLALDYPDRVRALVLVSTTDGAMVLDKDLPTIGNPRDYREVSKNIIVESFPAGTAPALYQPLLDRIPTWNGTVLREALTSMAEANVHGQIGRITALLIWAPWYSWLAIRSHGCNDPSGPIKPRLIEALQHMRDFGIGRPYFFSM